MSVPDRVRAVRDERAGVLAFCESLAPADWRMNSRAQGWSIHDVVAHMGAGAHAMFGPAAVKLMRGKDIERLNDEMVDIRRARSPEQVLSEYRRWTGAFANLMGPIAGTPVGGVRLPLAELGRFPLRLFISALAFDTYTHLHHDMAPALGRTLPDPDANRVAVALEWMMAVLSNQLRLGGRPVWLDRPVLITLSGPGGGRWLVGTGGSVLATTVESGAARIHAQAVQFPEWGTKRAGWRDRDVSLDGDADYGAKFLDWMRII